MARKDGTKSEIKAIATNRTASHAYTLGERFEVGIVLLGSEVKAAREGGVNLKEGFVRLRDEEAWLIDCHIAPYSHTGFEGHEPTRPRKLLMHKRELTKLHGKLTLRGLTLVPLRMYLKDGKIKLEIALAEGKKLHDKREAKRSQAVARDTQRELATRR